MFEKKEEKKPEVQSGPMMSPTMPAQGTVASPSVHVPSVAKPEAPKLDKSDSKPKAAADKPKVPAATKPAAKPVAKPVVAPISKTEQQFAQLLEEERKLHAVKNAAYGDSYSKHGTIGVLIRMSDKFARIENLLKQNLTESNGESVIDSFRDISVYAKLAIITFRNEHPAKPKLAAKAPAKAVVKPAVEAK
jgi:hypothetical protein